ncbi:MAG: UPF0182 family protein [Clostridia bacterium]|nr:UPF0182 family protein [Clostridia bacterium]
MIYDFEKEKGMKKIKNTILFAAFIALVLAAVILGSSIYMDVLQLNEIGDFSGVYITNILYKAASSAIVFVLMFVILSLTNVFIKKNINRYFKENALPVRKLPNFSVAAVVSLIGAFLSKELFYQKALNYIHAIDFGKTDPLFNADIGYYVFQRPLLMALYDFLSLFWLFVIAYTVAYYLFTLFLTFNNVTVNDLKIKTILRHNLINISIFFIIKALGYKFQMESVLYSSFINVTGAGYVDVNVWLNYFRVAPILILVIVILTFFLITKGQLRKAAYTIALFPAVWLIVAVASGMVQGFVVKPNEINLESQYLRNNMIKTREAYGLDKVKSAEFPAMQDLSPEIINRNLDTKNNIRVVDYRATLDSNVQLQSNTNFYSFFDGDIINYTINGKESPVLITAREIDKNRLPEKSYVNTMFKYTHGYGVVINPINRLTSQGQVEYILSGLRMNSVDPNLKVNEPRIYYGELTKDHVIVNAANNLKEIDYDGNTEWSYTGKGGVKLSFLNKLLFAAKYGDFNLLISGYVSPDSKLLLNRQIVQRAQMALPFLRIDNDPYIIVGDDGMLKWVIDAYTTTNNYPYSQRIADFNYIRNSAKVVVDAYNGTVSCHIIDRQDPIILAYEKIYPEAFSKDPLPKDVAMHSRYPEYLFKLQTELLRRYHLDPNANAQNVSTFYSKNDYWDIAKYSANVEAGTSRGPGNEEKLDIEPYYNMIKLPLETGDREELILMRPYTPSQKDNMVSWLAVRNSAENYGELILFNFPKNTNIFGPYQVDIKISQIDKVSKDISLWNQSGSSVFKGNLLVIPIENSVLYVEPIYIKSSGTSTIPEVREIVVGYQKGDEFKFGIGPDLDSALNDLFAGMIKTPANVAKPPAPDIKPEDAKTIEDIRSKYNELRKQLDDLGKLLDNLNQ